MLTDAEIARMRRNAAEAASRRVFKRPAVRLVHIGGPLDGWTEPVDECELKCMYRGWCALIPTGPVQAILPSILRRGRPCFDRMKGGRKGRCQDIRLRLSGLARKQLRDIASGVTVLWMEPETDASGPG
jgi:hypothetical protein